MADRFERDLKNLPVKGPSDDLRARIFGEQTAAPEPPTDHWWTFQRRIPMPLAIAAAFAAGLVGYLLPRPADEAPAPAAVLPAKPVAQVQIIYREAPTREHLFDFTPENDPFLLEPDTVEVEVHGDV